MSDYYEILGLSKKDKPSDSEIKKAYHRKAMKFHPDRMTGDNSGKKDIAEKKMADLNAHDLDEAAKIIAGSARSMGIEVKD